MEAKRTIEYLCDENTLVKEFIKKNISHQFYKFSKTVNATYLINGLEAKTYSELRIGDQLKIVYDLKKPTKEHVIVEKEVEIIYEDDYYLVALKEAGLLTIPSSKEIDSLFNRLLFYFKDTPYFPHILSRLDKETTGLVLVAKCRLACALIGKVKKKYLAITTSPLPDKKGTIDLPIAKAEDGIKRYVDDRGKRSITNYELYSYQLGRYYYKVDLETGRTHQIRVHFSHMGSPLVGDLLYNSQAEDEKLGLICYEIRFKNDFINKKIDAKIDPFLIK